MKEADSDKKSAEPNSQKNEGPDSQKIGQEVQVLEPSEDRAKRQSAIEKELEELRFSKLRFRGNSTYFCWELMKRTGIIEGKTLESKSRARNHPP